jgi:hypothetical protein
MLVACRLAGLSAPEGHYAGLKARTQFGANVPVLCPCGNGGPAVCRTSAVRGGTPVDAGWEEREPVEISRFRPGWASPTGRSSQGRKFAQHCPKRRGSQPTDASRLLGDVFRRRSLEMA